MNPRSIKAIHPAVRDDIADLTTRRALPTPNIQHLDPFLFLNHHGPQIYPASNNGLPFGPHPHRGFETVTFIIEGELEHQDTGGHKSQIHAGGIQWMTAGRGLIHSELSSEEFKKNGGHLEILQLWLNLPSRLKMTEPKYVGLQKDQIPLIQNGHSIQLISGHWKDVEGPVKPLLDVHLMTIDLKSQATLSLNVENQRNIFFYMIRGSVEVNGQMTSQFHLVEFEKRGEKIEIRALTDTLLLFGHAHPLQEPIVSHGPFVMNTREEILEAIRDYQAGKFE